MRKKKWPNIKQAIFLKRLGKLLQKGYSLLAALEFLLLQEKAEYQQELLECMNLLKQGKSLYEVFMYLEFHDEILGYLFYAEKHGDVAAVLEKAGILLEGRQKQQAQLIKIMKYPLFLCMFLTILLLFFNWILLPQFQSLFQSFQSQSTTSMNIIFTLLAFFPICVYMLLLLSACTGFYYFFFYQKSPPKKQMEIKLKIPFVKKIVQLLNTHYFSHQLGTLLQGGLSISEACLLMMEQNHQPFFKNEAKELQAALTEGYELETIIRERHYYDAHFSFIVAHGLANGTLGKELCDYSEYIIERLEETVTRGIHVIQPVIYTVIAIVIVLIYTAMLLPMFEMISLI